MHRWLLLLALVVSACGPPPPPAAPQVSLKIHTDVDAFYLEGLIRHFEKETGRAVEVFYTLDEMDLARPELKGDIVIARDAGALETLAQAGAIQPLPESAFLGVGAEHRGANWIGLCWRLMVLVHGRDTPAPASLLDVEGRLAVPASGHASVGWAASWIAEHGQPGVEKWLDGKKAKGYGSRRELRGLLTRMVLAAGGTALPGDPPPDAVLVDQDLWARHLQGNPAHAEKLTRAVPDAKKAVWSLTGIALRSKLELADDAKKFFALANSKVGQALLCQGDGNLPGNGQFAVREGIDSRATGLQSQLADKSIVPGADHGKTFAHRKRARELLDALTTK